MSASKTFAGARPSARQQGVVVVRCERKCAQSQGRKAISSSRRSLLAAGAAFAPMVLIGREATASPPPVPNQEMDSTSSPYIQELLKRTEENRDRRSAERLEDYYCRNFKDYFDFEIGGRETSTMRGVKKETSDKIFQWMKDHPSCKVGGVQ